MGITLGRRRGLGILVTLLLVAVVGVAGTAAMDDSPSGEEILNETIDRYENADSIVGTADITVENATETRTATVEFVTAANKSRITVNAENQTSTFGTNGTVGWYVGPDRAGVWDLDQRHEQARYPTGQKEAMTPTAGLNETANVSENTNVEVLRTERHEGVEAYVLRITPTNESLDARATLWIATEDSRLLRTTTTDGTNTTIVDVEETRFNVSVHESTFDPPSERIAATAFDEYDSFEAAQSNTSLDLPQLEAEFQQAAITERTAGTAVAQRYRADGDNVTVVSTTIDRDFERSDDNVSSVRVNGHDAKLTEVRGSTIVYWTEGDVTTAVIVDAGDDRAVEMARSLKR